MYSPTDIANLALDAIGSKYTLGDIEDGTLAAQVCLRAYPECRKRLLRGAHWQFARKQQALSLLADATGQTPYVGSTVPLPWVYEYAYPIDSVAVRFIPYTPSSPASPPGNYAIPTTPLAGGLQNTLLLGSRLRPGRFLIARDVNYPPKPGQQFELVQGVSPQGQTVVLTNIQYAICVYTSDVIWPSEWDILFRDAMIAYLAQTIAIKPGIIDGGMHAALEVRQQQIAITKDKLLQARISDGNETWSAVDHMPDWLKFRHSGGSRGYGTGEDGLPGYYFLGWEPVGFGNGSAY